MRNIFNCVVLSACVLMLLSSGRAQDPGRLIEKTGGFITIDAHGKQKVLRVDFNDIKVGDAQIGTVASLPDLCILDL